MRLARFLVLLPVIAHATIVLNMVEVTPANAKQLGVKVSVWDLATRDTVAITYPRIVDEVWLAEKAEIHIRKGRELVIFSTTTQLGLEPRSPIAFQFDDQDGTYDATVIIHYACANLGDERCGGFPGLMYNIISIAAYPKIVRR